MEKFLPIFKSWFLHIFFPQTCFCCGADMARADVSPLCPECMKDLKPVTGLICRRCGLPLKDGGTFCYKCRGSKGGKFKCSFIRSSLLFTPASRALVHALKYGGYVHIAKFFAPLLHSAYKQNPEFFEADFIVPVPIHNSRRRKRGFNQALLLAQGLSALSGVPCAQLITKHKKTQSQTALNKEARAQNVKNVFTCTDKAAVKKKAVILVDDVCTTSSTLEECARALKQAGAREVLAITVLRE